MRGVKLGGASATAGCGAGTDNSTCGPRAGQYSTSGMTALPSSSTCSTINAAISAGSSGSPNKYYLVQDLGSSGAKNSQCLTFKNNVEINLNGFTIYGLLCLNGNVSGFTVENGTLSGDISPSTAPAACSGQNGVIDITSGFSCPTNTNQFFDLTIRNAATTDQSQDIHIDYSVSSDCGTLPYWIDHVDTLSPPLTSGGSRTANLYLQGNQSRTFQQFKVTNSKVTFQSTSMAQQGIMGFNCAYCLVDHNFVDCVNVASSVGDSGRCLAADGGEASVGGTVGSRGMTFTYNYVNVGNNRGLRVRNSTDVVAQHNDFRGVEATVNTFPGYAFHLGDPDETNRDLGAIDISNNTIELKSNAQGAKVLRTYVTGGLGQSNTWNCHSGGCTSAIQWHVLQATGLGTRSEWREKNDSYGTGMTPNWQVQYGKTGDSSPVFVYCGTTPTADTSAGTVVAPTITSNCT